MVLVKKADGRKEEFDGGKIIATCMRAGLPRKAAEAVLAKVNKKLYDGIGTHDIYEMVLKELERTEDRSSMVFRLREAVSQMPSDKFELYVMKLLEGRGYRCRWNVLVKGRYVEHQADILAEKAGRKYLVECKHHVNPHRFCGLGIALQVQARLDDIRDGFREGKNTLDFSQAWIVTNTKYSEHAKSYASGKKIILSGWKYKGKDSLENIIQSKRMYPVSMLKLDKNVKSRLYEQNITTIQEAVGAKGIDRKAADYIRNQTKLLLG
ncbi:MAG: restriction endonuclease [Candidatus Aenigmarchaeota archaeon]|nr:restriction endonuclease [Candidatus Aenigmarchaeota archaeon]